MPALCRGIDAFGRGGYEAAIGHLEGAMAELARIGGSHAQRDVIIDTLIAARLRNGQTAEAEAAMQARMAARARHLDAGWLSRIGG